MMASATLALRQRVQHGRQCTQHKGDPYALLLPPAFHKMPLPGESTKQPREATALHVAERRGVYRAYVGPGLRLVLRGKNLTDHASL
jgi:hypothetical protein